MMKASEIDDCITAAGKEWEFAPEITMNEILESENKELRDALTKAYDIIGRAERELLGYLMI